jgi:hypothetical protein
MQSTLVLESEWLPEQRLIVTHISGEVNEAQIAEWEASLHRALAQIPDGGTFKIFVNLHGFKAVNLPAHKRFRDIVPLTLAQYGWRVGYLDLFEEQTKDLALTYHRQIRCVGAVHCHQDAEKIERYQAHYSRSNEHFYTDPVVARQWIEKMSDE